LPFPGDAGNASDVERVVVALTSCHSCFWD
jgi:hypothetical protein